jgi:hypothetical protein
MQMTFLGELSVDAKGDCRTIICIYLLIEYAFFGSLI